MSNLTDKVLYDNEKMLDELEADIQQLEEKADQLTETEAKELATLKKNYSKKLEKAYNNLTPWQRVLLARLPQRPKSLEFINFIFDDFLECHGDRYYGDDPAIITGFAHLNGQGVAIIGQQKGQDVSENVKRNFGMAHPEGYRKALRIMQLADKFGLPIVIFVDTPGAYPGIGAEERGQAEAIAKNIKEMFKLNVPILVIVVGEGASGGALGIGVGDRVLMLENTWYCVISPEGCAGILWKDRAKAPVVADKLKLSPQDLLSMEVIDEIIEEPRGSAHRNPEAAFEKTKETIARCLDELLKIKKEDLKLQRYQKYRKIGVFKEGRRKK